MPDKIIIGDNKFDTLVAISEREQAKGLMFQEWPPPVMVFPYKKAAIHKFWMKNTVSPLDIIFCYAGEVVSIHKGEPLSTALIGPDEPTDMVIELPYGTSSKLGIKPGDPVYLRKSEKTFKKLFPKVFSD